MSGLRHMSGVSAMREIIEAKDKEIAELKAEVERLKNDLKTMESDLELVTGMVDPDELKQGEQERARLEKELREEKEYSALLKAEIHEDASEGWMGEG